VAIQGEDEIASMGFCIGAAMAGSRVLTATSGPGISLYSESVGLAIMGEVPMVIVDVQRMGPATGGATTVAQGDIQFLRWGTSGGFPVIVLAPTDVAECYSLTRRAFDLAERFRVPVFVATDKETVLSRATVDVSAWEEVPVRARRTAPADQAFVPYPRDAPRGVPAMSPIGGPHLVRFTTSSHDEKGYLSKGAAQVDELNRRLASKVEEHADEIELVAADLDAGAETLVIAYGITARAVKEAVHRARREGASLSMLTVHSLWPVPEGAIRQALDGVRRVLVPELNLGQYVREIERLVRGRAEVQGLNRVDGELITPDEILAVVVPGAAA
jgi:2-oxoglutarate ferredoxin oxidoreductase subunit alpha